MSEHEIKKAAHGGSRSGAGRPRKNVPVAKPKKAITRHSNATVMRVDELARAYTVQAIEALVDVAVNGERELARVSAAVALLDRGHGRLETAKKEDEKPLPADTKRADEWAGLLQ